MSLMVYFITGMGPKRLKPFSDLKGIKPFLKGLGLGLKPFSKPKAWPHA